MNPRIKAAISESILVKQDLLNDEAMLQTIAKVAEKSTLALQADKKILFCGNGGSASDAQHLAAELSGRFYFDRDPLFAEALTVNSSYVTAVANDYGYEEIFARLVKSKGRKGDVLFGLSTSGNSPNVVKAFIQARALGMITVGMTGAKGGKLQALSDFLINVPSVDTPRIQEAHILVGHILCESIEATIFGSK